MNIERIEKKKFLVIQTAFIGDCILATSLIEIIKKDHPNADIHFLIRAGNESIVSNNKNINKLWVWNKKGFKYLKLLKLAFQMRHENYTAVFNIHRHASSGWVCAIVKAKYKVGFHSNPLSFFFTHKVQHQIPYIFDGKALHEVQRNYLLYGKYQNTYKVPEAKSLRPALYFSQNNRDKIFEITRNKKYVVIIPASVWFTKQWAKEKWQELVALIPKDIHIFVTGAPGEKYFAQEIIGENQNCTNMCGKLSLIESALLMENAQRVFVNDSSALHMASAVNAKTTAIFNSTIPEFGFFPLADDSKIIQTKPDCKPCGLHGHKQCPKQHFKCALDISTEEVLNTLK